MTQTDGGTGRRLATMAIAIAAAVSGLLFATASAAQGPAASQASVRSQLGKLAGKRQVDSQLELVLGPLAPDALPAGVVVNARLEGVVSTSFDLVLAASKKTRRTLGTGSVMTTAGEQTRLSLGLTGPARGGLRQAKKLVGTLTLSAEVQGTMQTIQRDVSIHPPRPPRCFGAASRDPDRRCSNSSLRLVVLPRPQDALLSPNAPCALIPGSSPPACTFPVATTAAATIALIGDSHASHWRAAVEYVAERKGWRGVSMTRAGCPLTRLPLRLAEFGSSACTRWVTQVLGWLRRHPEIHTVFVSQASGDLVIPPGPAGPAAAMQGFERAWSAIPESVERIVVIRDVPRNRLSTNDCIRRATAKRQPPGQTCAVPRGYAIEPDPAAAAARRLGTRRVGVVDLTRYFCTVRSCLPVVGGALVHKDRDHITDVFSTTLGPYLLRRYDQLRS